MNLLPMVFKFIRSTSARSRAMFLGDVKFFFNLCIDLVTMVKRQRNGYYSSMAEIKGRKASVHQVGSYTEVCFKNRMFYSTSKLRNPKVGSPVASKFADEFVKTVHLIEDLFGFVERNEPVAHIPYSVWIKSVVEILTRFRFIRSYTNGKVRLESGEIKPSLDCNLKFFDEVTGKLVTPLMNCIQVSKTLSRTWRYVDTSSFPSHFFILLTLDGKILSSSEARGRFELLGVELVGVILIEEIPIKSKNSGSKKKGLVKSESKTKCNSEVAAKVTSSKKK